MQTNLRQHEITELPLIVEHGHWSLDEFDERLIFDLLDHHGAILFRGFDLDPEGFHAFSSRFMRAAVMSASLDRRKVDPERKLETASLGTKPLPPHYEFGNHPLRPDLLWFYCIAPALSGGETTVHHGADIFEQLSPATRRQLCEKKMMFTDFLPLRVIKAMIEDPDVKGMTESNLLRALGEMDHLSLQGISDDDQLVLRSVLSPVMLRADGRWAVRFNLIPGNDGRVPELRPNGLDRTRIQWQDGTEIEPEILREISLAMEQTQIPIAWRSGDFVLIDNNGVMHGRNAWNGGDRRLLSLCAFSTRYRFCAASARGEPIY